MLTAATRIAVRFIKTVRDAPPFQMATMTICFARGMSYLTGLVSASAAEAALPHWALVLCLIDLTVGAGTVLVAAALTNTVLERRGLTLVCLSASIYGAAQEVASPRGGVLSFVIYLGIAVAGMTRIWQMGRIEATLRDQTLGLR